MSTLDTPDPILFDVTVTPHRSLSRQGYRTLILVLALLLLGPGLVFAVLGLWPVLLFCGAELALIILLFRLSYAQARAQERIWLTPRRLVIQRWDHRGRSSREEWDPAWLQILPGQGPKDQERLFIARHQRRSPIGDHLSPEERQDLAAALKAALALARGPAHLWRPG